MTLSKRKFKLRINEEYKDNFNLSSSPLHIVKKIIFKLKSIRRLQLVFVFFFSILSCASEVISLALVLPFLIVINNPEKIWEVPYAQKISLFFGIYQPDQLLLPITIIFVLAVFLSGSIRLLNLWFSSHLSVSIGLDISSEIYERVLYSEYSYHLKANSSKTIATLTGHVSQTIAVIRSLINLCASLFISIGIIVGLFFIDWNIALASISVFGSAYLVLAFIIRPLLVFNSNIVAKTAEKHVQLIQEGLGSIRDVILDSNQPTYLDVFKKADNSMRLQAAQNQFLGTVPRYGVEMLGVILIALSAFFLVVKNDNGVFVVPVLGAFALGSQRLLPALQQIFLGWSSMNSSLASLLEVLKMLDQPIAKKTSKLDTKYFFSQIKFSNVSFNYSDNKRKAVNNINFVINAGESIGIIGETGSGKSTTIDLLMGLLQPSSGKIYIDDQDLHDLSSDENLASWRASVSHVPQKLYFIDSSFAENIAFGVKKDLIDFERLKTVSKQAYIYNFIKSTEKGFDTRIGERGANLSGGQLQRIGIARALYKQSTLLVLDEATSGLDVDTEYNVMKSIRNLNPRVTTIVISHRLSSLKECDRIIKISKGSIVLNCTFNELAQHQYSNKTTLN